MAMASTWLVINEQSGVVLGHYKSSLVARQQRTRRANGNSQNKYAVVKVTAVVKEEL